MEPLKNKFLLKYGPWALVTGASDGIGFAIATELAARGLNLILVARRHERMNKQAEKMKSDHNVDVDVITADLGTPQGVELVLGKIKNKDIGLYVGCAGFGTSGPFIQNNIEQELNMIDVNCRSMCALAHPLALLMRERGKGGIIFMSSIVAFQGVANSANYAATKSYVQTFTEGLAKELKPHGIDVLASAPGPVNSGFASRADMKMGSAASPDVVARGTLDALGNGIIVRPGGLSKLLGYSLSILPRAIRTSIMSQIMTGMTKHKDE